MGVMRAVDASGAAAGGEIPRAVAYLFTELEPRLREALFAYAGPSDIDDAIGETFLILCGRADEILAMKNPRGYLYRVARDKVRGSRRLRPVLPTPRSELQPEIAPELVPALVRLSRNQRTVVFLGAGLGWTWSEIAEFLGTSVSSVRTHYHRGLTKLRRDLKEVDS
jgi:RNA polymerase sigma factor (sigma-70 family)